MRQAICGSVLALCALTTTLAQTPRGPTEPQPRLVIASVEGRWENVYCDLTELARTSPSELSVRFQYRNTGKTPQRLPPHNLIPYTRVFDGTSSTLFGVLKDAEGKPISSTIINVTSARPIPANGTQIHWAKLEPPPAAIPAVTVLIDGCLPFENVTIGATPTVQPRTAPAAAIANQDTEMPGITVELTNFTRQPGGFTTLAFRYRNTTPKVYRFPNQKRISTTYFLDSANRRKYEVLKDKEQQALCSESLVLHSQTGDTIEAGETMTMWAILGSPAETSKTASVSVPFAPPFDNVPISGSGSASARGGSAVAGSVVGLDAALKELNAKVSDTEIRIELAADVLFDFDKADIKKEAEQSLQNTATVIRANPDSKVSVEGHTDGKGADDYNLKLSEARAGSVKQWLATHGDVNTVAITTRGWGKSKPVVPNTKPDGSDDPAGRAKNRRVEIVVHKRG